MLYAELRGHMLSSVFNLYKFLTPQDSESTRLENFASWHEVEDPRTIKRYIKGRGVKPKQADFNNSSEYLIHNLNFLNHKRLWKSLKIICRYCDFRGSDCHGCSPADGCIHCKTCVSINICKQEKGVGKVPKTCKILKESFRYVDEIENLAYFYSPLKYVLALDDGLAVETLEDYKDILRRFLGEKVDIEYVSCVIRYAHMYVLDNSVSFLFLSRFCPEEMLERILKRITPDPIDDILVQLWNKCSKFEKELLLALEHPKCEGSVDDLLRHIENDANLADIIVFVHCFCILSDERLRPIDVRILKKCLCWKDCSPEKFFQLYSAEP